MEVKVYLTWLKNVKQFLKYLFRGRVVAQFVCLPNMYEARAPVPVTMCWCMPVILAFKSWRREIRSLRPTWATCNPVSRPNKTTDMTNSILPTWQELQAFSSLISVQNYQVFKFFWTILISLSSDCLYHESWVFS